MSSTRGSRWHFLSIVTIFKMRASLRNKTFHLLEKNVGDFAALGRLGLQQILLHVLQQDKLHVLTKAVLEKTKRGYIVSSSLS